jgi:hypothetical protein
MHRPVQAAHSSFIDGSHTSKNTASGIARPTEQALTWKKSLCMLAMQSWWKLKYISLILDDPQRDFRPQLGPHPICLLKITVKLINYILYITKLINLKNWGPSCPQTETEAAKNPFAGKALVYFAGIPINILLILYEK